MVVMKEYSYISTPVMGRTACTEPQCLYKGALYVYLIFINSKYWDIAVLFSGTNFILSL